MASQASLTIRRHQAFQRLQKEAKHVAVELDIEVPVFKRVKDPELERISHLEALGQFLHDVHQKVSERKTDEPSVTDSPSTDEAASTDADASGPSGDSQADVGTPEIDTPEMDNGQQETRQEENGEAEAAQDEEVMGDEEVRTDEDSSSRSGFDPLAANVQRRRGRKPQSARK